MKRLEPHQARANQALQHATMKFGHSLASILLFCLVLGVSGDIGLGIDEYAQAYLSPGESQVCVSKCASYKAGASVSSRLVCQYQASGVGSLEENAEGVSCFPAYNCREDWNLCVPQEIMSDGQTVADALGALGNVSDTAAIRAACMEISTLEQGGNSADSPPTGGWAPTSLGWHKGTGNIGCGWGSTYGHLGIETGVDLEEMGRIELPGFDGQDAEVDCCVEAMKYEGTPMTDGGAAIRFDVYAGTCRIDRALMMRGNLDASSGKSMDRLDACGSQAYFWRHASGAGDAANLRSAGRCVAANNFTRVRPFSSEAGYDETKPVGQLPNFEAELPNHPSDPTTTSVVYNTINTAEECCEACAELRWIGSAGEETNPCVAFQIVDGRCRILRLEWFDRYAADDLGLEYSDTGNQAMGVTEVIAHCAGFSDHDACARRDNSHGWWGSCEGADCDYFSHMYYRDPGCLGCTYIPPATAVANATYHKIQPITGNATSVPSGINVTFNVTVLRDRTEEQITSVIGGSDGANSSLTEDGSWGAVGELCAQIVVYESDAVFTDADGVTTLDSEQIAEPIASSEAICISATDTAGDPVSVGLGTIGLAIDESTHPEVFGEDAARRRALNGQGVVVSFECVGPGRDLCDFHSGALLASQRQIAASDDVDDTGSDDVDGTGSDADADKSVDDADEDSGDGDDADGTAAATTPAPTAESEYVVKVTSTLSGVTAEELRANLDGFRAGVASVHSGKTAEDVVVDEASIEDVERRRRRLLAGGVSVAYEIRGFASEAAANTASALQESSSADLTQSLKANGFSSLESLTSAVTVVDSSGAAIDEDQPLAEASAGRPAARVCMLMAVAALGVLLV